MIRRHVTSGSTRMAKIQIAVHRDHGHGGVVRKYYGRLFCDGCTSGMRQPGCLNLTTRIPPQQSNSKPSVSTLTCEHCRKASTREQVIKIASYILWGRSPKFFARHSLAPPFNHIQESRAGLMLLPVFLYDDVQLGLPHLRWHRHGA